MNPSLETAAISQIPKSLVMELNKPLVLLITGAWHIPAHYQLLSHRLRHQGYTVLCPLLMTNNNFMPPNKTLDDDVHQIRQMALEQLDAGRDIVALMHSYGGIVGSNALAGLGAADQGKAAHVKALIYMAAFIPFENESLAGIFGGALPPFLTTNSQGTIDINNPLWHFYHDLPPDQQMEYTNLLVRHPTVAQFEGPKDPPSLSAWRTIPVAYLFCSDDQALLVQFQEMMVDRIEQARPGLVVDREYCAASHSPFLSAPNKVADVVSRICTAVEQQAQQLVSGEGQPFINSNSPKVVGQS